MPLLVFWPQAGAWGAGVILPPCAQLFGLTRITRGRSTLHKTVFFSELSVNVLSINKGTSVCERAAYRRIDSLGLAVSTNSAVNPPVYKPSVNGFSEKTELSLGPS